MQSSSCSWTQVVDKSSKRGSPATVLLDQLWMSLLNSKNILGDLSSQDSDEISMQMMEVIPHSPCLKHELTKELGRSLLVNMGNIADDLSGPHLATGQDHERSVNHLDYVPLAPP